MYGISGHNFQYRIQDRIKNIGFNTFSEQSYIDDAEHKSRTIDFVALQKRKNNNPRGNQLALIVECKFLPKDVHCYMRPNPKNKKAYFIDGYNTEELFLDETRFHFFRPETVAMNIVKESKQKNNLYEAIMQSIKALFYLRGHERILDAKGLFFPVVVYGGPSKIYDQDNRELKSFLYYQSYEWNEPYSQNKNKAETRQVYVNVIQEGELEDYSEKIFKMEMDFLTSYDSFYQRMSKREERDLRNLAR